MTRKKQATKKSSLQSPNNNNTNDNSQPQQPQSVLSSLQSKLDKIKKLESNLTSLITTTTTSSSSSSSSHTNTNLNTNTPTTTPTSIISKQQTIKNEEKINQLRLDLCQTYSEILLSNLQYSYNNDIPNKLWRSCFYTKINDLRNTYSKDCRKLTKIDSKLSLLKQNEQLNNVAAATADSGGGGVVVGNDTHNDNMSTMQQLIQVYKKQEKRCSSTKLILMNFLKESIALYEYYIDQLHGMLLEYKYKCENNYSKRKKNDNNVYTDDDDTSNTGNENDQDDDSEEENNNNESSTNHNNSIMQEIMNESIIDNNNNVNSYDRKLTTFTRTSSNNTTNNTTNIPSSSQQTTQSSTSSSSSTKNLHLYIIPILYRIYIHLGDLYRYSNNYVKAEDVYKKASYLAPGKGNPYNQLAVCAQMNDVNDNTNNNGGQNNTNNNSGGSSSANSSNSNPLPAVALYWYCRSLLASHDAFMTSKSNLERLFISNQKWMTENKNMLEGTRTTTTTTPTTSFADITKKNIVIIDNTSIDFDHDNKEKKEKSSSRILKALAKRKFLCHFVHFHGMLFSFFLKSTSTSKTTLSTKIPTLLNEMQNLSHEFQSIMETNAVFGDSFLLKLVCINSFSVWNGLKLGLDSKKQEGDVAVATTDTTASNCSNTNTNDNNKNDRLEPMAIALIFALQFATHLCLELVNALAKGITKQEQKCQEGEGKKMFGSIRLIGPVFLACEFISNECYNHTMDILTKKKQTLSSSMMDLLVKSFGEFWKSVADAATIVVGNDALMTLIGSSDGDGDDVKELPDDFHSLIRGYRPFLSLDSNYQNKGTSTTATATSNKIEQGSKVYLTPEEAINALALDQSQTQTQTQNSQSSQRSSKKSLTQSSYNNGGQESHRTPEKIEMELKIKLKRFMAFITKHLESGELVKTSLDGVTVIKVANDHIMDINEEETDGDDNKVDFTTGMDVDDVNEDLSQFKDNTKDVVVYTAAESGKPALLVPGALLLGGTDDDVDEDKVEENNDAIMKEPSNVSDVTMTGGGMEERKKSLPTLLDPALLLDKGNENNTMKTPHMEESRLLAVMKKKEISSAPDLTALPEVLTTNGHLQSLQKSNEPVRPPPGFQLMKESIGVNQLQPPMPPGFESLQPTLSHNNDNHHHASIASSSQLNSFSSNFPLPQTANPFATPMMDYNANDSGQSIMNFPGFGLNSSLDNTNLRPRSQSRLPLPSSSSYQMMTTLMDNTQCEEDDEMNLDYFGLRSILSDEQQQQQNNNVVIGSSTPNFSVDSLFQNSSWKEKKETQNPFAF